MCVSDLNSNGSLKQELTLYSWHGPQPREFTLLSRAWYKQAL